MYFYLLYSTIFLSTIFYLIYSYIHTECDGSPGDLVVKNPPAMQEMQV